jgi:hypothetical protein
MTTERRKSPRRAVERIERVGSWGNVRYLHHLECGHVESRARASSAPQLACVMCLKVSKVDEEMRNLPLKPEILPEIVDTAETDGNDEIRIDLQTAVIAKKFGVPKEAVSIQVMVDGDRLSVSSGMVFLSAEDVERLGE